MRKTVSQPVAEEKKEEEGGNAAWDLTRKLKARMNALHGRNNGKKSMIVESRKSNFKKEMKLADSDETPDEFDPDDSDYDDDSDAESSDS